MSESNLPDDLPTPFIEPNAPIMNLLTKQFVELLDGVKELNITMRAQKATMDGVRSTLVDHGTKFDVLIRDALKSRLFQSNIRMEWLREDYR